MNTILLIGNTKDGHLRIISAHVSVALAERKAHTVMAEKRSAYKSRDLWEENPLRILAHGFPGRLVKAWKNERWGKVGTDLSSLRIVELDVEGTVLDQLASC